MSTLAALMLTRWRHQPCSGPAFSWFRCVLALSTKPDCSPKRHTSQEEPEDKIAHVLSKLLYPPSPAAFRQASCRKILAGRIRQRPLQASLTGLWVCYWSVCAFFSFIFVFIRQYKRQVCFAAETRKKDRCAKPGCRGRI